MSLADDPMNLRERIRSAVADAVEAAMLDYGLPGDVVPIWTVELLDDDPARLYRQGPPTMRIVGHLGSEYEEAAIETALRDYAAALESTVRTDVIDGDTHASVEAEIEGIAVTVWGVLARRRDAPAP